MRLMEDLIVSILLGDSHLKKNNSENEIVFYLHPKKYYILDFYIKTNRLENMITIKIEGFDNYVLKSSIVSEIIIRDWTDGTNVIALNPQLLRKNTYMLWLCLFGHQVNEEVVIRHNNLTSDVRKSLAFFFNTMMKNSCLHVKHADYIKIKSFDELLIESLKARRPSYESIELKALLTQKEKLSFDRKKINREGELLIHAY